MIGSPVDVYELTTVSFISSSDINTLKTDIGAIQPSLQLIKVSGVWEGIAYPTYAIYDIKLPDLCKLAKKHGQSHFIFGSCGTSFLVKIKSSGQLDMVGHIDIIWTLNVPNSNNYTALAKGFLQIIYPEIV